MTNSVELFGLPAQLDRLSHRLATLTDRAAAALMLLLVLDVWLGVFVRYVVTLPLTFTEELARYLMIWAALLAVSSCIHRREHIGVQVLFERLPANARRVLLGVLDTLGIVFFVFLLFYGVGMVERGAQTFTMIYGTSKALPFAALPVGAGIALIQLILVAVRDQLRLSKQPDLVVFP